MIPERIIFVSRGITVLIKKQSPIIPRNLNCYYRNFCLKIPFTLWMNILNFQKKSNIFTYDLKWYLKVQHRKSISMYVRLFPYLLICIFDLSVYVTQLHKCTNLRLLRSEVMVKWSRYRPGVAQRVGRSIALLFHDRGTRRWVSGQQHARAALYPPGKTRYPFYRRLGGPQGRSGRAENFVLTGIRSRTVQPVAQSLYTAHLSYGGVVN